MTNQFVRPALTWPEWSRKPENAKLIKENIHLAKRKYQNDLYIAENYNKYMMMMMGLISTPAAPAASPGGGSPALEGVGNYMIGQSGLTEKQFIVA